ncbi:hypothetical protein J6590_086293 [Homalodisca vitripennis]|nr:hypothetical protein J6590_086293 [Homalodisca vitripennis]
MACDKCKQLISNRKEVIKCEKCVKEFHVACFRVRTVAKLEGMTEKQIVEWRCEDCKPEVPAVTRPGLEDTAAMSILKSIQQEMLKNIKENKESSVALEVTLKNISTTLDGVQTKLTTLEKENAELYTRAMWLSAAKRKKIETTDLSPTLKQAPVYVKEHLTAYNRQLLGHAKTLVREKKLVYAWVSDGKILIRKTADSQAARVQDCEGANMVAAGPRTTTSEENNKAPEDTAPAYDGSNTTP